ncbi:MAG: cysteine synthase A [Planctomycetes bacterium]|nr:cysteine synthase A [Planctomycetota bacterium]NOG55113.1 cysteine synthase A [Planctomycetota bacterium]
MSNSTQTQIGPVIQRQTFASIIETIGNTRLVRLSRVIPEDHAGVYVKLEFNNPLASVKDRIGWAMIRAAEDAQLLNSDSHIIEPTSGNTGIALAFVCAARGYRLTLTMPDSMSVERRAMLRQLGANLVLTPAAKGMPGAIEQAHELVEQLDNTFMPQQFDNQANPGIHEATTGPEIWEDSGHDMDAIVTGVGTGGTITGVGRYLRSQNPDFKVIAVEPADSPVISGGKPGPHKIQGMGAGFIPANLDTSLLDDTVTVTNEEAFAWGRRLAREEGIMGGISTGANVCAAAKVAARPEYQGKKIVTIACSFGERYLSTPLFDTEGD